MALKEQTGIHATTFTQRNTGREVDTTDDPRIGNNSIYSSPTTRLPTSARRYDIPVQAPLPPGTYTIVIPKRSGRQQQPQQPQRHREEREEQPKGGLHWLVYGGGAMLIMVMGWVILNAVSNWWQTTQDDWRYGRPRTFQIDQVVGHDDGASNPSHFIALNLNRRVEIIEFPGGDPTHARIFLGPTLMGDGEDLTAVTLTFKDVNRDGKPDMIVHIQDQTIVFINDADTFRPAKPGENVKL